MIAERTACEGADNVGGADRRKRGAPEPDIQLTVEQVGGQVHPDEGKLEPAHEEAEHKK